MLYLDASALVKLILAEAESEAFRAYLVGRGDRWSCTLVRTEIPLAAARLGPDFAAAGRRLLRRLRLIELDRTLLDAAGTLGEGRLRTLDAIHVAAARTLGDELEALVTYDRRMQEAARAMGLPVTAPGQDAR